MTVLDVCSGIGGFSLALKHLVGGFKTVGYIEIDPYCQSVLRERIRDGYLDDAPIFSDLRGFNGQPYRGKVDCITSGFPCQPFSVAGKQEGERDPRNLWPELARVICQILPATIFLENVPALLTGELAYAGRVFGDLAACGYDLRWDCIPASACGAPHRRDRLWVVAHDRGKRIQGVRTSPLPRESIFSWCKNVRRLEDLPSRSDLYPSRLCRSLNGIPAGVDRLRALGNAVVPAVVAKAWEVLSDESA